MISRSRRCHPITTSTSTSISISTSHHHHYRLEEAFDDDDFSIVYGEQQTSVDPRSNPHDSSSQPTQYSQQTVFSRRSGGLETNNDDVGAGGAAAFISRDERRKRRREWKERALLEEREQQAPSPFPEEEEDHDDDHDSEDEGESEEKDQMNISLGNTFASLQRLLEEGTPPSQQQEEEEEDSCGSILPAPNQPDGLPLADTEGMIHERVEPIEKNKTKTISRQDTEPMWNVRAVKYTSTKTRVPECFSSPGEPDPFEPSPPDFCMINDDDDDSEEEDTPQILNEVNVSSLMERNRHSVSKGDHGTKKKKQKEKEEKIRDKARRARSSPPPTPQFETPQSPPPPPNRKRRRNSAGQQGKPGAGAVSRPITTTKVTENSKTIVGMRPTHWQRPTTKNRLHASSMRPLAQSQQAISRMKLLKAATVQPMHVSQPNRVPKVGTVPRSKDLAASLRKENLSSHKLNSATGTTTPESSGRGTITAERLRKMTYHPQSMPKPRGVDVLPSPIEGDDDGHNTTMINNIAGVMAIDRPSFSSPATSSRRHRSSKSHSNHGKTGPWTKRLAALKSTQTNDAMKLQHPGMNRHCVSFDLNDPRKRAKYFTDVTILTSDEEYHGGNPKSWSLAASGTATFGDPSLLTVLCHIHQHARSTSRGSESSSSSGEMVSKAFAWISFTRTTARNIGLRKGIELRLYDAVLLPVRRIIAFEGGSPDPVEGEMDCRFLVICTQLCETHPGKLDPVPNFDLATLQTTSTD